MGLSLKKKKDKKNFFVIFLIIKVIPIHVETYKVQKSLIINYNLTTSRTFFCYHFSIYLPGLLFRYIYMCTYVYIHTMFLLCILFLNKIILYILFHNQPFLLTIYHELFSLFSFFNIFIGL